MKRPGQMNQLKERLDKLVIQHNRPSFIKEDPICVPHAFSIKQDIEISGFFAASFAWGNRKTIIRKSMELMNLMDNSPYQFILHHKEKDLKRMLDFNHRTFNATDLLYFIAFLRHHFSTYDSLETAFTHADSAQATFIQDALTGFYDYFFSLDDVPSRTRKHIATPKRKSTCKRLNMFLRWMVRRDESGVDLGIWKTISPSQLVCPVDVHVARVARQLGLLRRRQTDWLAAMELTSHLRIFDPNDPVKYDFALFSLSAMRPILTQIKTQ